jgi:hypothetical protein
MESSFKGIKNGYLMPGFHVYSSIFIFLPDRTKHIEDLDRMVESPGGMENIARDDIDLVRPQHFHLAIQGKLNFPLQNDS